MTADTVKLMTVAALNSYRPRSYCFVLQLKPQVDWKPWQKPQKMEVRTTITLVVTEIAARQDTETETAVLRMTMPETTPRAV